MRGRAPHGHAAALSRRLAALEEKLLPAPAEPIKASDYLPPEDLSRLVEIASKVPDLEASPADLSGLSGPEQAALTELLDTIEELCPMARRPGAKLLVPPVPVETEVEEVEDQPKRGESR